MKRLTVFVFVAFTAACAGMNKMCSQTGASMFGSDWIVAQYDFNGKPFHCWKLRNAAVDSSEGGNVDWKDPNGGHLVHLTGWENRVQVKDGDFVGAGQLIGIDANQCANGIYSTVKP